jgi:hypothetical protein
MLQDVRGVAKLADIALNRRGELRAILRALGELGIVVLDHDVGVCARNPRSHDAGLEDEYAGGEVMRHAWFSSVVRGTMKERTCVRDAAPTI